MKYLSLFSGIGGFELGIKQAYENLQTSIWKTPAGLLLRNTGNSSDNSSRDTRVRATSLKNIGYSEIDKYATQIYQKHFPEHKNYGDITKINEKELPDFDFLCGGFPCQSFSIAGRRRGFADTRGTLFFDICRILDVKRPKLFLLENVKGLLNHDEGRTFTTIITSLDELGYDLQWQVLNSKNFGVPQNRERVFIIGHIRGTPRPKVFPITRDSQPTATVAGYINEEDWPRRHEQIRRVYKTDGAMPTIPTGTGGGVMTKIQIQRTPLKFLQRNQKNIEGDYAFTVDSMNTGGVKVGSQIRRLTPLECERLQGFPDNWTAGISDSQRYKCCGNAVTTNVVQAIMEKLLLTT